MISVLIDLVGGGDKTVDMVMLFSLNDSSMSSIRYLCGAVFSAVTYFLFTAAVSSRDTSGMLIMLLLPVLSVPLIDLFP